MVQKQDLSSEAGEAATRYAAASGVKVTETYDEIYIESWKAALDQCETKLEPLDYQQALSVKNIDDFRQALDKLQRDFQAEAPKHVIGLLYPILDDYDKFAKVFVQMLSQKVEVSMLWGLLFLVIRLSIESKGTIDHVSAMLEQISHKLRRLNECTRMISDYTDIKRDAITINKSIINLWLGVITMFRQQTFHDTSVLTVQNLEALSQAAIRNIGDAVQRVERLAERAERKLHAMDLELLQKRLEALSTTASEKAALPCFFVPVAENKAFFGREDVMREIDEYLQPSETGNGLKALALHGLGGMGKTQVALAYAYAKRSELDAVFWVPAQDRLALQRGFSELAIALRLAAADSDEHEMNMAKVMGWLQNTTAKWLLIYDNVEAHDHLNDCWPAFNHGAVLITTRNHTVASQPVGKGVELTEFSIEDSVRFMRHLLPDLKQTPEEDLALEELSRELRGYALALTQMTAYIRTRKITVQAFLKLYRKYPQKLHREKKPGWKYVGYHHGIDTVWEISFDSLGDSAAALLGIMSFLSPDKIPVCLFEDNEDLKLPNRFEFCEDELSFGDAVEQLTTSALVRQTQDSLSLHRLVQAECLFRMTNSERQEEFDATVKLLHSKAPSRFSGLTKEELNTTGNRYLAHVTSVARKWQDSQSKSEALKPSWEFCDLMLNTAWFLIDMDTGGVQGLAISCAQDGYKALPSEQQDELLYCDILGLNSLFHLSAGDFVSAENLAREAYKIKVDRGAPADFKMTKNWQYLGLSCDSALKHDEARLWYDRLTLWFEENSDPKYTRFVLQNKMNSARNYYNLKRYAESEQLLDEGLVLAIQLKSPFMLGYLHHTYACLFGRTGDLNAAQAHVTLARQALDKDKGSGSSSMTGGLCAYRAAYIAVLQDRAEDAIEEAEKCCAMDRLYKTPTARQARSNHILHRALSLVPSRADDARKARSEAQRLRSLLPPGRTDLNDESDLAFDLLIPVNER